MKTQRLRLRFQVSERAAGSGHRDLLKGWERAAAEAKIGLSYSQGKRPVPQISIASLLPQGATSSDELMDVFLEERLDPDVVKDRLQPHLQDGVALVDVEEVGMQTPSIQSQLRRATYEVEAPANESRTAVQSSIDRLLESRSWPAELKRETKVRKYDLRPLVIDVRIEVMREDCVRLRMSLRAEQERTASADQVVLALGLSPARRIHRIALHLDPTPAAVLAYRRSVDA